MAKKKPVRKKAADAQSEPDPEQSLVEDRPGITSAGQSGDDQGLSGIAESTSESVRELVEEGQYFEAGVVEGVENAPDPDEEEVRTREKREDDVPLEYTDEDQR